MKVTEKKLKDFLENVGEDIPDISYFANQGVSNSDLSDWKRSPAYYEWKKSQADDEPTDDMLLGSAVHAFVLGQQDKINVYFRGKKKSTKEYKEALAAKSKNDILLTEGKEKIVNGMLEALNNYGFNSKVLSLFDYKERSFFTVESLAPDFDIKTKCKADAIGVIDGRISILDYKTTKSAPRGDNKFWWFANNNYLMQATHYSSVILNLLEKNKIPLTLGDIDFYFLVQENSPPYLAYFYKMDSSDIRETVSERKSRLWEIRDYYARVAKIDVLSYIPICKKSSSSTHFLEYVSSDKTIKEDQPSEKSTSDKDQEENSSAAAGDVKEKPKRKGPRECKYEKPKTRKYKKADETGEQSDSHEQQEVLDESSDDEWMDF